MTNVEELNNRLTHALEATGIPFLLMERREDGVVILVPLAWVKDTIAEQWVRGRQRHDEVEVRVGYSDWAKISIEYHVADDSVVSAAAHVDVGTAQEHRQDPSGPGNITAEELAALTAVHVLDTLGQWVPTDRVRWMATLFTRQCFPGLEITDLPTPSGYVDWFCRLTPAEATATCPDWAQARREVQCRPLGMLDVWSEEGDITVEEWKRPAERDASEPDEGQADVDEMIGEMISLVAWAVRAAVAAPEEESLVA